MGAINMIATILNMRAPGIDLMKMPLFVLDLADHRVPADRGDAGAGRRVTMMLTDKFTSAPASSTPPVAVTR
jgi:cytochrome c oxidase subunit 1